MGRAGYVVRDCVEVQASRDELSDSRVRPQRECDRACLPGLRLCSPTCAASWILAAAQQ